MVAVQWFTDYFAGRKPAVTIPYSLQKTSLFGIRVLTLLTEIPYGTTVTYGELAKQYRERYGAKKCLHSPSAALWGEIRLPL